MSQQNVAEVVPPSPKKDVETSARTETTNIENGTISNTKLGSKVTLLTSKTNLNEGTSIQKASSKSMTALAASNNNLNSSSKNGSTVKLNASQTKLNASFGSQTKLAGSPNLSSQVKLNTLIEAIPAPATTLLPMNLPTDQMKTVQFTSATLGLFKIDDVVDTTPTETEAAPEPDKIFKPSKLVFHFVSTPNIIADVQARGVLSDFQPFINDIIVIRIETNNLRILNLMKYS
jgi:hypothetical protein